MDNNKSLIKTEDKTNSEMRRMYFKNGGDIGMTDGRKTDPHEENEKSTKQQGASLKNTTTRT